MGGIRAHEDEAQSFRHELRQGVAAKKIAEASSVAMPAARKARFCMTMLGTRALSPARRSINRNATSATQASNRKRISGAVQPISSPQSRASAQQADGKRSCSGVINSSVVLVDDVRGHHSRRDRFGCCSDGKVDEEVPAPTHSIGRRPRATAPRRYRIQLRRGSRRPQPAFLARRRRRVVQSRADVEAPPIC